MLTENSMYGDANGRVKLIGNKELCAELFVLNFLGFVGLYALSDSRGYMKTYESTEKKLTWDDIGDENHDVSLIIKLCVEADVLDKNKIAPLTKFLFMIKSKTLKSKDIDEDKLRAIIKTLQITTKPMNAIIRGNLNDWMNGVKTIHQLSFDLYNMAKKSDWRDYTLEFRTLVVKGQYNDFFSEMSKGTWVKPGSTSKPTSTKAVKAATPTPAPSPSAPSSQLEKDFKEIFKSDRSFGNLIDYIVSNKPDPKDILDTLKTLKIEPIHFVVMMHISYFEDKMESAGYLGIYEKLCVLFFKLAYTNCQNATVIRIEKEAFKKYDFSEISAIAETGVNNCITPTNSQEFSKFLLYKTWAYEIISKKAKEKNADIKKFCGKTPSQIFKFFAYTPAKFLYVDETWLSDSDKKFVSELGQVDRTYKIFLLEKKFDIKNVSEQSIPNILTFIMDNIGNSVLKDGVKYLKEVYIPHNAFEQINVSAELKTAYSKIDENSVYKMLSVLKTDQVGFNDLCNLAFYGYLIYLYETKHKVIDVLKIEGHDSRYDHSLRRDFREYKNFDSFVADYLMQYKLDNVEGVKGFAKVVSMFTNHVDLGQQSYMGVIDKMKGTRDDACFVLELMNPEPKGPHNIKVINPNPREIDASNLNKDQIEWVKKFGSICDVSIYVPPQNDEEFFAKALITALRLTEVSGERIVEEEEGRAKKLNIDFFINKVQPILDKRGLTTERIAQTTLDSRRNYLRVSAINVDGHVTLLEKYSDIFTAYTIYTIFTTLQDPSEVDRFLMQSTKRDSQVCDILVEYANKNTSNRAFNEYLTVYAMGIDGQELSKEAMNFAINSLKISLGADVIIYDKKIKKLYESGWLRSKWCFDALWGLTPKSEYNKGFLMCVITQFRIGKRILEPQIKELIEKCWVDGIENAKELKTRSDIVMLDIDKDWKRGFIDCYQSIGAVEITSQMTVVIMSKTKKIYPPLNEDYKNPDNAFKDTFSLLNTHLHKNNFVFDDPELRKILIKEIAKRMPYIPTHLTEMLNYPKFEDLLEENDDIKKSFAEGIENHFHKIDIYNPDDTFYDLMRKMTHSIFELMGDEIQLRLIKLLCKEDLTEINDISMNLIFDNSGNVAKCVKDNLAYFDDADMKNILEKSIKHKSCALALNTINKQNDGIKITFNKDFDLKQCLKFNNIDFDSITTTNIETMEDLGNVQKIVSVMIPKIPVEELDESETKKRQLYLHKNNAYNHDPAFGLKVKRSYKYENKGMKEKFDAWCAAHPKAKIKTLFHGTGSIAGAFILRFGFKIIPSDNKAKDGGLVTARMLGDGIYFADNISKSAFYMSNAGYLRKEGVEGYIFKCKVAMDQRMKDYREGWAEEAYKHLVSNEWCVFNTDQCLIEEVYECVSVYEKVFKSYLDESKFSVNQSTFMFMDGNIPIDLEGHMVDWKAFPDFGPHVYIEPSGRGPVVHIKHDTSVNQVHQTYKWGKEMKGVGVSPDLENFIKLLKNTY